MNKRKITEGVAKSLNESIEKARLSRTSELTGSVSAFDEIFGDVKESKDPLADPNCASCEGRGFYHVLDVGEYDEQQTTVQCACKRKHNDRDHLRERR